MVEHQLRDRGIRDERVLEAMARVPREAFVPEWQRSAAYADAALPIPRGQTISQPFVVARMTELLGAEPGMRVLEIGTGSGYQAAILAELGAVVTSIERVPELAASARERLRRLGYGDRVDVRIGDGTLGEPDGAPWPRIIATAAAPRVPVPLREQLDPDHGRLVIPVGGRGHQDLLVVVRSGDEWIERSDGAVVFVPLVGEEGWDGRHDDREGHDRDDEPHDRPSTDGGTWL
ncbi:MAG TPA: protein-L-isoaspartate(D-aspartate) O-methyltransferase [Candidatus Limnocylindrales bacterium]|nr:protein-L-isoaspartate(D-aspartate) O-methyltransferase [Candidatus Limnocylindrales bacterium]